MTPKSEFKRAYGLYRIAVKTHDDDEREQVIDELQSFDRDVYDAALCATVYRGSSPFTLELTRRHGLTGITLWGVVSSKAAFLRNRRALRLRARFELAA
jgi:hypothetical protein